MSMILNNMNTKPQGVIILEGDFSTLGVAHSLGRAGIPIFHLAQHKSFIDYSRYSTYVQWPGPEAPDVLQWLVDFASQRDLHGWLLIPSADDEVRLISQNHTFLSDYFTLCTPPWERLKWAADKNFMFQKAIELNVPTPRTYEVRTIEDVVAQNCIFPLVVKPVLKERAKALDGPKAWHVDNLQQLPQVFQEAGASTGEEGLIVQEFVPGDGKTHYSYAAIWKEGEPLLSMVSLRSRQIPPDFGIGCYAETVDNPQVEEFAEKFLRGIQYDGIIEMEFKQDSRYHICKLLDANPRFWTWNSISMKSGKSFSLYLWKKICGDTLEHYRVPPGYAWMDVRADLRQAFRLIRQGRLGLIEYVKQWMNPKLTFSVFAWDDPMPFVMITGPILKKIFIRFFARIVPASFKRDR